jgi:phosphatidylserine/phosphatidylglycerophosphate/cardiolipin synthase-like enzyme
MPKFLNTSATNYHLEELIKGARDRLILISPFLKLNDRIKELLADKDRLKIDVRIVYGKSELAPAEIDWLKGLTFVRTAFCKNLHAKCYLSEESCIVTSLNLYEFSMVNNNEMGVLIRRAEDVELYRDAYEEAQRIIRISEEVRISLERVDSSVGSRQAFSDGKGPVEAHGATVPPKEAAAFEKLTSAKLAAKLGISTKDLVGRFTESGFLELKNERHYVAAAGKQAGIEWRPGPGGGYLLWPANTQLPV